MVGVVVVVVWVRACYPTLSRYPRVGRYSRVSESHSRVGRKYRVPGRFEVYMWVFMPRIYHEIHTILALFFEIFVG